MLLSASQLSRKSVLYSKLPLELPLAEVMASGCIGNKGNDNVFQSLLTTPDSEIFLRETLACTGMVF